MDSSAFNGQWWQVILNQLDAGVVPFRSITTADPDQVLCNAVSDRTL